MYRKCQEKRDIIIEQTIYMSESTNIQLQGVAYILQCMGHMSILVANTWSVVKEVNAQWHLYQEVSV